MPDGGGGPAAGRREAHPGDAEECRHQGTASLPLAANPGSDEWSLQWRVKIRDGAEGGSNDREHRELDLDGDLKRSILPALTACFQKTSCVSFRWWLPSARWVP